MSGVELVRPAVGPRHSGQCVSYAQAAGTRGSCGGAADDVASVAGGVDGDHCCDSCPAARFEGANHHEVACQEQQLLSTHG